MKEYVDCLADHLDECPIQHKAAVEKVKTRWTQFISTCALTLPFQDEDSGEIIVGQTQNDQVRSQLNGVVSLSQANVHNVMTGDKVLGNLAERVEEVVDDMKDAIEDGINTSREINDNLDDLVETVRDIIVPKINSAQPILQRLSGKSKAKADDDNDNSKADDEDDDQNDDVVINKGSKAKLPGEPISVEVLNSIVDFLNDQLSADDGEINTDLGADDSEEEDIDDGEQLSFCVLITNCIAVCLYIYLFSFVSLFVVLCLSYTTMAKTWHRQTHHLIFIRMTT